MAHLLADYSTLMEAVFAVAVFASWSICIGMTASRFKGSE